MIWIDLGEFEDVALRTSGPIAVRFLPIPRPKPPAEPPLQPMPPRPPTQPPVRGLVDLDLYAAERGGRYSAERWFEPVDRWPSGFELSRAAAGAESGTVALGVALDGNLIDLDDYEEDLSVASSLRSPLIFLLRSK